MTYAVQEFLSDGGIHEDECNPPEYSYDRYLICTHCNVVVAYETVCVDLPKK